MSLPVPLFVTSALGMTSVFLSAVPLPLSSAEPMFVSGVIIGLTVAVGGAVIVYVGAALSTFPLEPQPQSTAEMISVNTI